MRVVFYSRKFIDFFRVFVKLVFCFFLLTLAACDRKSDKIDPHNGVFVKIAQYDENTGIHLQSVRLTGVTDLIHLKGENVQFQYLPRINEAKIFTGRDVQIQVMENRHHEFIAENEFSLGLLTSYWHFDQLIKQLQNLGFQNLIQLPIKVGVVHNQIEGNMTHNNASYIPDYDSFLIQPYDMKATPILLNSGVIAHEFFHMLFQKLFHQKSKLKIQLLSALPDARFLSNSTKDMNLVYHSILLRSIEEGLADFWGWSYSKDEQFVYRSIPVQAGKDRSLADDQISELKSKLDLEFLTISYISQKNEVDQKYLLSEVYRIGSRFARQLKLFSVQFGIERTQLALLRALLKLQETTNQLNEDSMLEPDLILYLTEKEIQQISEKVVGK